MFMNLSKGFTIFFCLLSIPVFAQLEQAPKPAPSQRVDQNEEELRIRFFLHEEREIEVAAEVAKQYLKQHSNGIYASYLKTWLDAFETAKKSYQISLYKRADFMLRWREQNYAARDNLFTQELQKKAINKRGVVLVTNTLADIEARAKSYQPLTPPADILPPPPKPAVLAPVDCDDTENCFNANAYTLLLEPVSAPQMKSIEARLTTIEKNESLLGCYDIRVVIDGQINIRCRYVRKVEIKDPEKTSELIKLPRYWAEPLKNQQISRIWLENGIRVDSRGIPLEQPIRTARPIAVQTNTTLYLVSERFDSEIKSQAGHVTSFKNKVFDISECTNQSSCVDHVMSKYLQKAEMRFAAAPLSVPVIGNEETPPGEIWLGKTRSRSDVLGLPWHEVSRYVIKWYGRDSEVSLFDLGGGKGKPGRYLFLEVEQEYTLSPNVSGTYRNAAPAQESKYKEKVDQVVRQALVDACTELRGNMVNEVRNNQARKVCVIPRR